MNLLILNTFTGFSKVIYKCNKFDCIFINNFLNEINFSKSREHSLALLRATNSIQFNRIFHSASTYSIYLHRTNMQFDDQRIEWFIVDDVKWEIIFAKETMQLCNKIMEMMFLESRNVLKSTPATYFLTLMKNK